MILKSAFRCPRSHSRFRPGQSQGWIPLPLALPRSPFGRDGLTNGGMTDRAGK